MRHELADMVSEISKVVDFGISKIRRTGGQMTRDMTILGTPQFMSPEAALGQNSQLDGRADQWSLAVIMYLSLSGRLPFDGENLVGVLYMVVHEQPTPLKELAPEVPDHVVAAINKAMSKRKDERFARMGDFVRAILGHGVTTGVPLRFTSGMQMSSAVFRVPAQLEPQSQSPADAPTAVPHLSGTPPKPVRPATLALPRPSNPPGQPASPFPPSRPDVATVMPQTPLPPEAATRPNIGANMLPLTMPAVPHAPRLPELVATPTSPTTMNPFPAGGPLAAKPRVQSGDTPTSISMDHGTLQAMLEEDRGIAGAAASMADSSETPRDAVPLEPEVAALDGVETTPIAAPPTDFGDDPPDLQAQPTRVASMAFFPSQTSAPPPTGEGRAPMESLQATVPLTSLKKMQELGIDTAYPSTLSRATGQQDVSLKPPLLPAVSFGKLREIFLSAVGWSPRSTTRLAISGGALGLTVLLILVLALSGGNSAKVADKDVKSNPPASVEPENGTPAAELPDGGGSGSDNANLNGNGDDGKNGKKPKTTPSAPPAKKPNKGWKSKPKMF